MGTPNGLDCGSPQAFTFGIAMWGSDVPKSDKFPSYKQAKVADLVPYARNARTHSKGQVDKIAASIKEFGFLNPVITDGDKGIVSGHGRVMAAQKLKMDTVPIVEAAHLTEHQKRAYILADNRLALDAGWDNDLLRVELSALDESGFGTDLTGFGEDEMNKIFAHDTYSQKPEVYEVESEPVRDRFWITVKGPLPQQAEALSRLKNAMEEIDGLEVILGTSPDGGFL